MLKYIIIAIVVSTAVYYISNKRTNMKEGITIGVMAAVTLVIIDCLLGTGREGFNGTNPPQEMCPHTNAEVGQAYIKKYGAAVLARKDLNNADKITLIFQNMKNDLDNLTPPISDWNNHAEIARRLKLC